MAVAIGAGGWLFGHSDTSRPQPLAATSGHVITAQLTVARRVVGEVVVWTGKDPWISMAVNGDLGTQRVACQLRLARGAPLTLGWFSVRGGRGFWVSPIGKATSPVVGARLVGYGGDVLAAAALPPTAV